MKIPPDALIAPEKLTKYLLVPLSKSDKSRYLARAGFNLAKKLSGNLMSLRRRNFRPQPRSDDEATSIDRSSRSCDAGWGRKVRRPSGGPEMAHLRRCCSSTTRFVWVASSLRLASGPFPAHRRLIRFSDSFLAATRRLRP